MGRAGRVGPRPSPSAAVGAVAVHHRPSRAVSRRRSWPAAAAPACSRASVRRRSVSRSSATRLAVGHHRRWDRPGRPRQDEHEARADAQHARGVELATHRPGEVACDRQAQTGPGDRLVIGHPVEAFEDPLAVARSRCPALRRGLRSPPPDPRTIRRARPARSPANLIALAARFVTICSTRRRSPVAERSRGGADTTSRTPRSSAIGISPADTALRASATENGSCSSTSVPDSIRDSSRRSSTSAAIELTMVRPRSMNSRSTSGSPTRPSRIRSR